MNEIDRAFSFITSQLTADATLTPLLPGGIHQGAAPALVAGVPYLVFGHQGGHDVVVSGMRRVMNDGLYRVIVWGPAEESYAAIAAADDEADVALTRKSGAAGADGKVLQCAREQPLALDDVVNGIRWIGLGGMYRIAVQPASGLAQ